MKLCECGCGRPTPIARSSDRTRGYVRGQPLRFVRGHNRRTGHVEGGRYRRVYCPEHVAADLTGILAAHVAVVVAARGGRPLPSGTVIHHVNGDPLDNRRQNLVVCQDNTYHRLLHVRTDAFRATGDPRLRRCGLCGEWGDPETMYRNPRGHSAYRHRECQARYARAWRRRRTEEGFEPQHAGPGLRGEACGMAKLSDAAALEISRRRARGEPGTALAEEFGVSPSLVSLIHRRKIRQHLWTKDDECDAAS